MIHLLRSLARYSLLLPLTALIYDLMNSWFLKGPVYLRSLEVWWKSFSIDNFDAARAFMQARGMGARWDGLVAQPAALCLLAVPVLLYIIYRAARLFAAPGRRRYFGKR